MDTFKIKIVTPERIFFEGEATMVEFNTTEGRIGVYKRHVPTTVVIETGILTITLPDGQKNAALHSGFVEILPDQVTFLAETVEWPDEIDKNRAESALDRAKKRINGELDTDKTDIARAKTALARAVTRIGVLK